MGRKNKIIFVRSGTFTFRLSTNAMRVKVDESQTKYCKIEIAM
jgi:hypothetical protein